MWPSTNSTQEQRWFKLCYRKQCHTLLVTALHQAWPHAKNKCSKGGSDEKKGNQEKQEHIRDLQRAFWRDKDACWQTIALNNVMMQVHWFHAATLWVTEADRAVGGSLNTYSAGGSWIPSHTWRSDDRSWRGLGSSATQSRRLWHLQRSGTCPAHQDINHYSYFYFLEARQSLRECCSLTGMTMTFLSKKILSASGVVGPLAPSAIIWSNKNDMFSTGEEHLNIASTCGRCC